jgi:hypothetical protein
MAMMRIVAIFLLALSCTVARAGEPQPDGRIKRTQLEGAIPVTELTRDEAQKRGIGAEGTSPRQTVDRFVSFYLSIYKKGFPGAEERAALRPIVTLRFMGALEAAARGMDCDYATTGGKEPPPSEGDIFVSLFEGATSIDRVTELERNDDTAVYSVDWVFADPLPGREKDKPARWKDRILLHHEVGRWLIDDFSHDGTWGFMTKGNVSSNLKWIASFCAK